jgi:N-acetylmuramic acid 6-phosphate etherase
MGAAKRQGRLLSGFAQDIIPSPPGTSPGGSPACGGSPSATGVGGVTSLTASQRRLAFRVGATIAAFLMLGALAAGSEKRQAPAQAETGTGLLKLLQIEPSAESVDYVRTKTPFQLHTLLTEQRHPKTWPLGERVRQDTLAGLKMLSSVDDDIRAKMDELAAAPEALEQAARAVEEAIVGGRKIYVYGCGATGRLAKQMESAFWRPFWRRVKADRTIWRRLRGRIPAGIEDALIGEMTGADRALISSLEGFEDLQLIGRLQLRDRGVTRGDVVICVTEGGETSSVIGTVLAALGQWRAEPGGGGAEESRRRLYFVYNNPDDRLMPFERSRSVLTEPGITKINLTTGPQAITGSTRMQATTIETYVVAAVVETAVGRALGRTLGRREMARLGFAAGQPGGDGGAPGVSARLREFGAVLDGARAALPRLAQLTDMEAAAYAAGRFSTYYAEKGLITVFIDSTERSPTFRLHPLDTVNEPKRKCWIQVWTRAGSAAEAWRAFLGRPFRGLAADSYRGPFETQVEDPYLRRAALESLKKAGDDQAGLYDFSLSKANRERRGPAKGDVCVLVALSPEEAAFDRPSSSFVDVLRLAAEGGADAAVLLVTNRTPKDFPKLEASVKRRWSGKGSRLLVVPVHVRTAGDPFGIRQQMAAKMLLNAHSTAVMAKLGKVVGNTMTNVSPSNLKLIGRATSLIQSHVNDVLGRPEWVRANGAREPVTYGEANAVLYDAIAYLKDLPAEAGQTAEVALSIVRILESLRQKRGLDRAEALAIVKSVGLSDYLAKIK